jgi:hypothetical protein
MAIAATLFKVRLCDVRRFGVCWIGAQPARRFSARAKPAFRDGQTTGGARARNMRWLVGTNAEANPRSNRGSANSAGSSTAGCAGETKLSACWRNAQIAQNLSARPPCLEGLLGRLEPVARRGALEASDKPAASRPESERCVCPWATASWMVNANSVNQDTNRTFDRSQFIKVEVRIPVGAPVASRRSNACVNGRHACRHELRWRRWRRGTASAIAFASQNDALAQIRAQIERKERRCSKGQPKSGRTVAGCPLGASPP